MLNIKGRDNQALYAEIIEALLNNDESKASELLLYFHPDELGELWGVAGRLRNLCLMVVSDYPDIGVD